MQHSMKNEKVWSPNKDDSVPYCKSFMHLHLGVKKELIPEDAGPLLKIGIMV